MRPLTPERVTDDVVVMLPDRQWELFDGQADETPSHAHDDTRQFVLQKLQAIAEAAKNPLIAPEAPARARSKAPRAVAPEPEPPVATEPEKLECPVTIAATEAVADTPVFAGFGPSSEVIEHLRQFRRQQNRISAFVFSAVGCASVATFGGLAYILA